MNGYYSFSLFIPHSSQETLFWFRCGDIKLSSVCVYVIRLVDLKHSNAAGIVSAIKRSFESIDVTEESFDKYLIGFVADGAMVSRGEKDGVISILQRHLPWVIYVWCVTHHLELALKDALQGTIFDDVDEVLLCLYYLYENSPKKLWQLRDLHRMYSETFQFEQGGIRLKWACGMWFGFHFAY